MISGTYLQVVTDDYLLDLPLEQASYEFPGDSYPLQPLHQVVDLYAGVGNVGTQTGGLPCRRTA